MSDSNKKNKGGRPKGGTSLATVTMADIMAVCNSSAKVTVGRVWAENAGILNKDSYKTAP